MTVYDPETCFTCGQPATMVRDMRLRGPADPNWLDVATLRAEYRGSGIRLRAAACAEHDDALAEAFLDHFGTAPGWSTEPPHDERCPGRSFEPVDQPAMGDLLVVGYACRLCGFQTMTTTPAHDPEDLIYKEAREIIDKWLGEPVPGL